MADPAVEFLGPWYYASSALPLLALGAAAAWATVVHFRLQTRARWPLAVLSIASLVAGVTGVFAALSGSLILGAIITVCVSMVDGLFIFWLVRQTSDLRDLRSLAEKGVDADLSGLTDLDVLIEGLGNLREDRGSK